MGKQSRREGASATRSNFVAPKAEVIGDGRCYCEKRERAFVIMARHINHLYHATHMNHKINNSGQGT